MKFSEVQKIIPGANENEWFQHPNGRGWIQETATVSIQAYVGPNAIVYGEANIGAGVSIEDESRVYGYAKLFGSVRLSGRAIVHECACIYGNAEISGDAEVSGIALLGGNSVLQGDGFLTGNQHFTETQKVNW